MIVPAVLAMELLPAAEALALVLGSAGVVKLFDLGYKVYQTRKARKLAESTAHLTQSAEVRRIGIDEVDVVLESMRGEIARLNETLQNCHGENRRCEQSINQMTIDNLRLTAKVVQHEFTINQLERKAGLPETDFGLHETKTSDPG